MSDMIELREVVKCEPCGGWGIEYQPHGETLACHDCRGAGAILVPGGKRVVMRRADVDRYSPEPWVEVSE